MAKALLLIYFFAHAALAQDADAPGGFHFQPPRPPPMDSSVDIEEPDDDEEMEIGDEPLRPALPAPPSMAPPGGFSPPTNFGSANYGGTGGFGTGSGSSGGGIKFRIVDGAFWEKGKKRERGNRSSR